MKDVSKYFFPLAVNPKTELPRAINYPYYYQPHPLVTEAAKEVQASILKSNLGHAFGTPDNWIDIGKMFGVLIVRDLKGNIGYLKGFSGKLGEQTDLPPFVPPVFNRLAGDEYKKLEAEIEHLTVQILDAESNEGYKQTIIDLQNSELRFTSTISRLKKIISEGKAERKVKRQNADEETQRLLDEQSKREQYELKHFKKTQKIKIAELGEVLKTKQLTINHLKKERKALSQKTQETLFRNYTFLNAAQEAKSLLSIFKGTAFKVPPSGAGECAAPKLFQFAFEHQLEPIVFGEFWFGKSPNSEIRKHLHFYPACTSKCAPILGHMLSKSEVEVNPIEEAYNQNSKAETLFEDDYIIALNKPAGMLSVPGKKIQHSVLSQLESDYPNATGPLLLHRLDMSTSGILLAAKTKDVHENIQKQFQDRKIQKRYLALIEGLVKENEGVIELPLTLDIHHRPSQKVCFKTGKPAKTKWKKIAEFQNHTKIELQPITGRTHQLRVHCAHKDGIGIPIKGDDLYGDTGNRLFLHAASISFTHPILNKKITINAPTPF